VTGAQITHIRSALCGDSSAGLLVEFLQHAAGYHVTFGTDRLPAPITVLSYVELTCTAMVVPPSTIETDGAVLILEVVVPVESSEHFPVGSMLINRCIRYRIAGVSAVPVHRQLILANLITDGERRVFRPVPQTVSTLDLQPHNASNTLRTYSSSPQSLTSAKLSVREK